MDLQNLANEGVDNSQVVAQGAEAQALETADNAQAESAVSEEGQEQQQQPENTQPHHKLKKNGFQKRIDQVTFQKNELQRQLEAQIALNQALLHGNKNGNVEQPATELSEEQQLKQLLRQEALQILQEERQKEQLKQREQTWSQKIDSARAEYEDFDEIVSENLSGVELHDAVTSEIKSSDIGGKLIYHLAQNPDEAEKLATLSVPAAIKYLGKLEAKLESASPQAPTVNKAAKVAPQPIRPVTGKAQAIAKDPSRMTMAEHAAHYYNNR